MFGRFLELSLATEDVLGSVRFYERCGFGPCAVGDAWPHRYGVLADSRIALGVHARALDSPAPSFVLPELARAVPRLLGAGLTPELRQLQEEGLHWLLLRDPGGQPVILQEARSFSPAAVPQASLCGRFLHLSLPQSQFTEACGFWERAGLVALPPEELPYPHLPLTSDSLNLALHARAACASPLLVFESRDPARSRAALDERGIEPAARRLPPLAPPGSLLLQAPEGTLLLVVPAF